MAKSRAAKSHPRTSRAASSPLPQRARKARPLKLAPDASSHAAARESFRELEAHYAGNAEPRASLLAAPERVHQLRVALRRLRVALSAFGPLLGEARSRSLAREARAQFRALGAVRDLDVLVTSELLDALPAKSRTATTRALAERRKAAAAKAGARLATPRAEQLARALAQLARELPEDGELALTPALELLTPRLERLWRRTRRGLARTAAGELEQLHDLRKHGKRLRYTVELAAPLVPAHADQVAELLRALEKLQDALGAYLDRQLGLRTLARLAPTEVRAELRAAAAALAEPEPLDALVKRARELRELDPFWEEL